MSVCLLTKYLKKMQLIFLLDFGLFNYNMNVWQNSEFQGSTQNYLIHKELGISWASVGDLHSNELPCVSVL